MTDQGAARRGGARRGQAGRGTGVTQWPRHTQNEEGTK